jgi:hypothetical protein
MTGSKKMMSALIVAAMCFSPVSTFANGYNMDNGDAYYEGEGNAAVSPIIALVTIALTASAAILVHTKDQGKKNPTYPAITQGNL